MTEEETKKMEVYENLLIRMSVCAEARGWPKLHEICTDIQKALTRYRKD